MKRVDAFERYARRRRRSSMPGQKRKEKEADERRFTWEVRSCSPTGTAAALPRLLRHFVLLSYTHSLARSLPPSHTHLLTHALSISVSFNPSTLCPSQQPPLSLCLNLFPVFPSPFLFLLHVASVSSRLLFSVSASHHL